MPAYLLLLAAVLTRIVPHPGWLNFTAVGATLLYFGARRSWREMLIPVTTLMATDFFLTTFVYHYGFRWQDYIPTWTWYLAAMVLGRILLKASTTAPRFVAAVLLGPTSFFLLSNCAAWLTLPEYPKTLAGLAMSYIAGIPFYRNDLMSTTLISGVVFGVPVLVHRMKMALGDPAGAGR